MPGSTRLSIATTWTHKSRRAQARGVSRGTAACVDIAVPQRLLRKPVLSGPVKADSRECRVFSRFRHCRTLPFRYSLPVETEAISKSTLPCIPRCGMPPADSLHFVTKTQRRFAPWNRGVTHCHVDSAKGAPHDTVVSALREHIREGDGARCLRRGARGRTEVLSL